MGLAAGTLDTRCGQGINSPCEETLLSFLAMNRLSLKEVKFFVRGKSGPQAPSFQSQTLFIPLQAPLHFCPEPDAKELKKPSAAFYSPPFTQNKVALKQSDSRTGVRALRGPAGRPPSYLSFSSGMFPREISIYGPQRPGLTKSYPSTFSKLNFISP